MVNQVVKRSKKAHRILHCCNHIGFQWADRHRGLLMAVNIALGVIMFSGGVVRPEGFESRGTDAQHTDGSVRGRSG